MAKVAYTNNEKTVAHIDGKALAPGDTREVDETQIPTYKAKAPAQESNEDPVLALLDIKGGVKNIVPELPGLSDADLARLKQAEDDGKTRDGLMKAIAVEELKRADAKAAGDEGENTQTGENTGGDDDADNSGDAGAQE